MCKNAVKEVIFDKDGIKIIKSTFENSVTYIGINLNDNCKRKYIQSPCLEDVKNYIGC